MAQPLEGVTAAVLAGGLGTRLRSVVADRPKVLAEVAGRPFLSYLLDQLAAAGVRETILLVGYRGEMVRAAFGDAHAGMRLVYSAESEPLGTGGAARLALPHISEPTLLLVNGDSYCDADLRGFRTAHVARPDEIGILLAEVEDSSRYGKVELADDRRVVRFEEKRDGPAPGWINAGLYLIPRDRIAAIPEGRAVSLERDVLPGWVAEVGVRGYSGGRFIDIGLPETYAAAEAFLRTITGDHRV